jgi:AcrR family transcriptional regulator
MRHTASAALVEGQRQGSHVAEMQRRRLLTAVVELAYAGGVQALSVGKLCARAGLSRRTFYDLFEDRDDCLRAAFEDGVETVKQTVVCAVADEAGGRSARGAPKARVWSEHVRAGLVALLSLLDREPGLGHLLIVDGLGLGPRALEVRRRVLAQATRAIDSGRAEARAGREPPPLTAEGTVGAVLAVVHDRLLAGSLSPLGGGRTGEGDGRPLTELTGPLMALIVHPYLGSAAARRELQTVVSVEPTPARRLPADPFKDLPIRLTYRTALVLSSIAQSPGSSSRQVADASGITDPGQISRLLTRLRSSGLIEDSGVGPAKGMARAWSLTERGEDVLQATGQV